jgi:beta-lactamase superfamily II metal-dependent hydrolase
VGPNTYGHPDPEIRSVLEATGAEVWVTMEEGDVSLELAVR